MISPPVAKLSPNGTRSVLVVVPFDGALKRRVRICAEGLFGTETNSPIEDPGMRKISRHPHWLVGLCAIFIAASPLCGLWPTRPISYQSNTQYGVALPNASLPTGSDEVRAADGTSCRSAVGGDGAYMDTGVIGSPGQDSSDFSGAVYTRLVVPLGGRQKRLNCAVSLRAGNPEAENGAGSCPHGPFGPGFVRGKLAGPRLVLRRHEAQSGCRSSSQRCPYPRKLPKRPAIEPTPEPAAADPIVTSSVVTSDSLY